MIKNNIWVNKMTRGKLSGCKQDVICNVRDGKCSDTVLNHSVRILVDKRSCWPTWSSRKSLEYRSGSRVCLPACPINITMWGYVSPHTPTVYRCYTLNMLKNPVCHEWWAHRYLVIWTLTQTNALYASTLNMCVSVLWKITHRISSSYLGCLGEHRTK